MQIEITLIDGGSAVVDFKPPTQTACLSFSGTLAGLGDMTEPGSLLKAFGYALDFLAPHCDKEREWFDVNVEVGNVLEAANSLLESRMPSARVVGKSESSPDS